MMQKQIGKGKVSFKRGSEIRSSIVQFADSLVITAQQN